MFKITVLITIMIIIIIVIHNINSIKTDLFNAFFSIPHTCHFETRPSPVSKIGGNAVGAQFLQLYHKKRVR